MGIQRAAVLYPVNSTTVDTGAGIDIRLLDSAEAGADDDTQTATATHTQDSQSRTFDPGSATSANEGPGTLRNRGWALRLSEDMTPGDDTNCDAALTAGSLTVNITMAVNQAGGTYVSGTYTPLLNACLFRVNLASNTGTFIANGLSSALSWNLTPVTGDLGTFKTAALAVDIPALVQFSAGEVLLLQFGIGTATIPNPTLGTATFTYTLRVDHANTNITFAAGQGIRQACALSASLDGRGTVTRGALLADLARSAVGKGEAALAKAVLAAKTFALVGTGEVSHSKLVAAARTADLIGLGTPAMSRVVVAAKAFDLDGRGIASESPKAIELARSATGTGEASGSREVIASKAFDLVGTGLVTETHPVQAFRSFNLVGRGTVSGTITIPIDEVPTEGGGTVIRKRVIIYDKG